MSDKEGLLKGLAKALLSAAGSVAVLIFSVVAIAVICRVLYVQLCSRRAEAYFRAL